MARYRKRPVEVDAFQWIDIHTPPAPQSPHPSAAVSPYRPADRDLDQPCKYCGKKLEVHGWVDTLEGGHIVCPGDFIVTGIKGESYPCKPDVFEKTYEPVEEL